MCLPPHVRTQGHTPAGSMGRGPTGFKNGPSEFAKLGNVSIAALSWHLWSRRLKKGVRPGI